MPIVEPGLDRLVTKGLLDGLLRFGSDNLEATSGASFVFLCLPTPQGPSGRADLSCIEEVAGEIGAYLDMGAIVVTKSTVPVGSTRLVAKWLGRDDVEVVSNPEFLREGSAVTDFLAPDRIVVGAESDVAADKVAALYRQLGARIIVTDPESAEIVKYASNAFLATKLSFVNAMAMLCEAVGGDIREVTKAMGHDSRIGGEFLRPGPGWGGSCFPKDTAALVQIAADAGCELGLLAEVIHSNDTHFDRVTEKVVRAAGGSVEGRVVTLWGVTFKAATDDLRMSPSLEIAARLRARGATIKAFDPKVARPVSGVEICGDAYSACEGSSVILVATEWGEFQRLDYERAGRLMLRRAIVDSRNLLDPSTLRAAGFWFSGMGFADDPVGPNARAIGARLVGQGAS